MHTPLPLKRVLLLLAVILALATAGVSAPVTKSKPKPAPVDDTVTPAIDPARAAKDAKLRAAADHNFMASNNNLKQIAQALHDYATANKFDLPDDFLATDGKPLLSWRVRLLPYLKEQALYKQFRLNEPWDSEHNLGLLEKMPRVFASPRVIVKRKGYTVYQVFSGPNALWHAGKSRYKVFTIPDGTANTLYAVEMSKAVTWTKPADMPFDKDKKLPDFGKAYDNKPLAALMDGTVRLLDLKTLSVETLKNAIMPDDGKPLGPDW
jgi:hypothetical protein